jgi:hypothetical protein
MGVVSFTPRPLYPQGKSPWYPLDRRLGGPQSRSGHGGEEKNSQPPSGIESLNPDCPCSLKIDNTTHIENTLKRAEQVYIKKVYSRMSLDVFILI